MPKPTNNDSHRPPTQQVVFRLPVEVYDRVVEYLDIRLGAGMAINKSEVLRRAVARGITEMERESA